MNLVNLESVSHAYGPKRLLHNVSLGIGADDRIGVVGRNGCGKTTLISVISGELRPDEGRVTHARGLRIGKLSQRDELDPDATVRDLVLDGRPEHEWAADPRVREVVAALLGSFDLGAKAGIVEKSGSWFSYDSVRIGQGRENAKQYLKDNPEVSAKIERAIRGHTDQVAEALMVGPDAEEEV